MALEDGVRFLTVNLLGSITVSAFKNKNRKDKREPHYIGDGIAIWINEKKAAPKVEEEQI